MQLAPEIRSAALRLLQGKETPRPIEPALGRSLDAHIRATLRRQTRRYLGRGLDEDDVVQEVLLRLSQRPPSLPEANTDPAVRLFAWVRTTTVHLLIDMSRRKREEPDSGAQAHTPATRVEPALQARNELVATRRVLEQHYPLGVSLFDVMCDQPEGTTADYAQLLGISVANVDQIRCRIRKVCATYLDTTGPHGGPDQLAEARP